MDQLAILFLVFWLLTLIAGGLGWAGFLLWWYDPGVVRWGTVWHDLRTARSLLRISHIGQAGLHEMLDTARRYGYRG